MIIMPSPVPFGSNPHGVSVRPLDLSADNSPTTKTFHGVTIAVNGRLVGRVQSWQPSVYNREGTHIYELSNLTFGRPVDYVPGISTGYTVAATRTEVWDEELEIAFGYPSVWADLIDQNRPFNVQEYLYRGEDLYRVWLYTGCWFNDRNDGSFGAQEAPSIIANANLSFVSRIRVV